MLVNARKMRPADEVEVAAHRVLTGEPVPDSRVGGGRRPEAQDAEAQLFDWDLLDWSEASGQLRGMWVMFVEFSGQDRNWRQQNDNPYWAKLSLFRVPINKNYLGPLGSGKGPTKGL